MQAYNISTRAARAFFALAVVAASVAASATSIQYSFTVAPDILDWVHDAYGDSTKSVSLTRFDSSLGTLTGVKIHLAGAIVSDVQVANMSRNSANTITTGVSGNFTLVENGLGVTVFDENVANSITQTFSPNPSSPSGPQTPYFSGVSGATYDDLTASGAWTLTSSDLFVLNYVTGASPLLFTLSASDSSDTTGTANLEAHYDTLANASGWIEYTYDKAPVSSVPAPPAIAAMISGLSVAMRRRKRGSAK